MKNYSKSPFWDLAEFRRGTVASVEKQLRRRTFVSVEKQLRRGDLRFRRKTISKGGPSLPSKARHFTVTVQKSAKDKESNRRVIRERGATKCEASCPHFKCDVIGIKELLKGD